MFTDDFCRSMEHPETSLKDLEEGISLCLAMALDIFEIIIKREGKLDTRALSLARTELEGASLRMISHEGECSGSSIQDGLRGI